jgi:hypothetical protein
VHPFRLSVLLLAAGALLPTVRADNLEPATVIAVQVRGDVGVAHGSSTLLHPVPDNAVLAAGDLVETGPDSGVVLVLPNGSTVSLRERSQLVITQVRQAPFTAPDLVVFDNLKAEPSASVIALELKFGEVIVQVRKLVSGSEFSLKTPVGAAGTAGAAFALAYTEDADGEAAGLLSTAQGLVRFTPPDGRSVEAGRHKQVEVRAHVGRAGVAVQEIQTRGLADEAVGRIEDLNRAAREDVNQVLQRARAMRQAPQPPADRIVRPEPPRDTTQDRRPEPPAKPAMPRRPTGN